MQESACGNREPAKRPLCSRCRRPQRVCICSALPKDRISLAGRIIILQHPHETKLKLATVPVLQLCLSPDSLTVIVGRRLKPGTSALFEQVLQDCLQHNIPLLLLWPGPGAAGVDSYAALVGTHRCQQQQPPANQAKQQQQQQQLAGDMVQRHMVSTESAAHPAYVLLAVDSTWRFAKEMFDSLHWLLKPNGIGVQIQLPISVAAQYDSSSHGTSDSGCRGDARLVNMQHHKEQTVDASLEKRSQPLGPFSSCSNQSQQQQQQQHEGVPLTPLQACADASVQLAQRLAGSLLDPNKQQPAISDAQQKPGKPSASGEPHGRDLTGATSRGTDIAAAAAGGSVSDSHLAVATLPDVGCRLRTEPHESCCTTYEAVSRAVACLEGPDLLPLLLRPLQLMTQLQAQFDPAVQQRMQQHSSAVVTTKSKLGMRNRLESGPQAAM